jgi:putative transcriptional regulator
MRLTNTLKALRLKNGDISQQQLAEMIGCSRQTIHAIESGCKNPSVEIALKISHALGSPMDEIFSLEEGKEKDHFLKRLRDVFKCPFKK